MTATPTPKSSKGGLPYDDSRISSVAIQSLPKERDGLDLSDTPLYSPLLVGISHTSPLQQYVFGKELTTVVILTAGKNLIASM